MSTVEGRSFNYERIDSIGNVFLNLDIRLFFMLFRMHKTFQNTVLLKMQQMPC